MISFYFKIKFWPYENYWHAMQQRVKVGLSFQKNEVNKHVCGTCMHIYSLYKNILFVSKLLYNH